MMHYITICHYDYSGINLYLYNEYSINLISLKSNVKPLNLTDASRIWKILPGPEDVVDAALVYDREAAIMAAKSVSHIFQLEKNINNCPWIMTLPYFHPNISN